MPVSTSPPLEQHQHAGGVQPTPFRNRRLSQFLLFASTVGSMLLTVSIGAGLVLVDPVFAAVILVSFIGFGASGSEGRRLLGASLPCLWLVVLGSTLALLGVGLQRWALVTMLRDAFVFATFFALCELAIDRRIRYSRLMGAAFLSLILVELAIFSDAGSYRPKGTFENPNYAGHFLALGLLLLLRASKLPVVVKAALTASTLTALVLTGSFGGVAMLSGGVAYLLWARFRTHPRPVAKVAYGLLLCTALASSVYFTQVVVADVFHVSDSVNAERLDRSASDRLDLWRNGLGLLSDHPLGVGPGGLANRDLLGRSVEIHNDYVAYLIERGPLGLLGLISFGVVLWRFGGRWGATRLMLIPIAIGMMSRETLHFRHMWLFLAFAFAYDVRSRRIGAT